MNVTLYLIDPAESHIHAVAHRAQKIPGLSRLSKTRSDFMIMKGF